MTISLSDVKANRLLNDLPATELGRWHPFFQRVQLTLGEVLFEAGDQLTHVYFPTTAIVSLQHQLESGASAEIALIGREGVVGIALFMGAGSMPNRAVVLIGGEALRLDEQALMTEFGRGGVAHDRLLVYTLALITQMSQTAVCYGHHSVDQRMCRWLLLCMDRLNGDDLAMTQSLIADMLGVRRASVTEAALKLQNAGLIRYARGHIRVLDRAGLELRCCECYEAIKSEYLRLLGGHRPT